MSRRNQFDKAVGTPEKENGAEDGIFDLPPESLELIAGGMTTTELQNFYQGDTFAQNYSCFAQNIGDFSQGTPPS